MFTDMLVLIYQPIWVHFSKDHNLQTHRREYDKQNFSYCLSKLLIWNILEGNGDTPDMLTCWYVCLQLINCSQTI
jgi:hypothetical protein